MADSKPPSSQDIKYAMGRNAEVIEALAARKGHLYALRADMFVACTKMQVECFGTNAQTAFNFAKLLVEAFDIPDSGKAEFIDNCEAIRKAQEL